MHQLATYLGKPAASLLEATPFNQWTFKTSVEHDLPEHITTFHSVERGLEIACDSGIDENIRTIFLHSTDLSGGLADLIGLSFSSGRNDVHERFGPPSRQGAPSSHKILGEYGPWDRYDWSNCFLHIQYRPRMDEIQMITLMRPDVAP